MVFGCVHGRRVGGSSSNDSTFLGKSKKSRCAYAGVGGGCDVEGEERLAEENEWSRWCSLREGLGGEVWGWWNVRRGGGTERIEAGRGGVATGVASSSVV